jgi:peptidoglycan/xylan/chitin deacetylase (PgdA/CDA1 family)
MDAGADVAALSRRNPEKPDKPTQDPGILSPVIALFLLTLLAAGPRAVAVTFDDLPCNPQEGAAASEQVAINRAIVRTIAARKIPAVGFVNEVRLQSGGAPDPARVAALTLWLDAGLTLGNHTFSHPSLHRTPLPDYLADISRGEDVTRGLLRARGQDLRWFRHPFLQTGRDLETKAAVEAYLAERGVRVAPVTMDNAEWIFARAYLNAKGRQRRKIADAYLTYMEAKTDYWERQSVALLGREIPQVLLVHANRLNADHFERVAAMLARRGYRFVALEAALADEAYASEDRFTGPAGISWLHRWALTRGGGSLLVPDEPMAPSWILEAAGVEGE